MAGTTKQTIRLAAGAAGTTCLLLLLAFYVLHMLPFGPANLVLSDAHIQYIDFFAWLQRCLRGEDSLIWSFARGLGGNTWPVFTYYLSSPWSLLVLLFQRDELYTFYDIVVMLKLSAASAAMAVYLASRFAHRIPSYAVLLLSVAYALSEYGVHQSVNIMWLDGFCLLPLVLLGVWRAGTRQGGTCLVLASVCAMIFNWYSVCIDLLFAGLFACWEGWVACGTSFRWRAYAAFLGRCFLGLALGAGLSAIVFVPTLAGLSDGRGSIDWQAFSFQYHGKLSAFLTGQLWGSLSERGSVSLFVGAFAFLGAAAFFWNAAIPRRWRLRAVLLLLFLALVFYWQPFYFLFSLLKQSEGFYYRYGSIGIFLLIYLAGWNASAMPRLRQLAQKEHRKALACLCIFSLADLWCNFGIDVIVLHVKEQWMGNTAPYQSYVRGQDAQAAALQALEQPDRPFRVNQTKTFFVNGLNLRANYNEGMASGMKTIATYTSAPVNAQMALLDRFGYRQNGSNMNIVNTSVLGTDALLGVRYVLADRPIAGLRRRDDLPEAAGKAVYENPFALPLAFACSSTDLSGLPSSDPFRNTNEAYGRLFGQQQPMAVYRPVSFTAEPADGTRQTYTVAAPSSVSGQLYGNIRGDREDGSNRLSIDDGAAEGYLCWLAPSVFDIPGGQARHAVVLSSDRPLPALQPQFYAVDETVLHQAAALAWSRAADVTLGSETALIRITGHGGEKLFTSLPWDKGWKAVQNGRDVRPERIADALMGFTLDEGENEILLRYELPGSKEGACLSICSLAAFLLMRRRRAL